jgi:hypothetical protein
MRRNDRLTRPPRLLRRRHVRRDNVALVPASLLPFKARWQKTANALPEGSILICLPPVGKRQRRVDERVAADLKARGHRVTMLR